MYAYPDYDENNYGDVMGRLDDLEEELQEAEVSGGGGGTGGCGLCLWEVSMPVDYRVSLKVECDARVYGVIWRVRCNRCHLVP